MRQTTVLSKVLLGIAGLAALCFLGYIVTPRTDNQNDAVGILSIAFCFVASGAAAFCDWIRNETFKSSFGKFDAYLQDPSLRADAQNIVSRVIEKQRQVVQQLFDEERRLARERKKLLDQGVNDEPALEFKLEQLAELDVKISKNYKAKTLEKRKFWRLCKIARWWRYKVPKSVDELAIQQPVAT